MRKRVYLAGICSVLALSTFGLRQTSASQGKQAAESVARHFENGALLAFAPPDDDDKPRRKRPKRVKDDDNPPPAKKVEPKKDAAKTDPAKADAKDAKPAAPEPPALVGPTTVGTPQESLALFSMRVFGRIGERLAGTPVVAETRPAPSKQPAKADTKKGATADKGEDKGGGLKMGKKSPFNRGKNEKKGNNTAQNGNKKNGGGDAAPVDPDAPVIKIDPSKIGKAFRKGDSKKR